MEVKEDHAPTIIDSGEVLTQAAIEGTPATPALPPEKVPQVKKGPDDEEIDPEVQRLEGKIVAVRYKVIRKIGEGGMGSVFLAEHVTIAKKVALKVLHQEYTRKPIIKERFLQEAKAAAKIGHENIVDIIDFGSTPNGSLFFAMEFLEGEDLSRVLQMEGPFNWDRAKPILLQLCRALGAAHSSGIIHRDLKPENIFLEEREGRKDFIKVLDFGIAKVGLEEGATRLTRTGMVFGTPQYMSPEQALGKKPDNRVDIYSAGIIMYEMLTGQVPFTADSFMGILTKHVSERPVSPSVAAPDADIHPKVENIILKAMAKSPEDRFQSMAEMAVAISRTEGRAKRPTAESAMKSSVQATKIGYADSEPVRQDTPYEMTISQDILASAILKSRRWMFVVGAVLILALVSVIVVLALRTATPAPATTAATPTPAVKVAAPTPAAKEPAAATPAPVAKTADPAPAAPAAIAVPSPSPAPGADVLRPTRRRPRARTRPARRKPRTHRSRSADFPEEPPVTVPKKKIKKKRPSGEAIQDLLDPFD